MATIEKRLQVTPTSRVGAVLRELSAVTGQPVSMMVRELLDEAYPTLEATLHAMRQIRDATSKDEAEAVAARFARQMVTQSRELLSTLDVQPELDLDTARKRKPGRKPGKAAQKGKGKGARSSG
jgi:hypothetical protein